MPVVTVVIPAYNPGSFIETAVKSVIRQTFQDWGLVVVDDGSPTPLPDVTSMHPRIRVIRQSNAGQSQARNTGIEESNSPLVSFLDQDDVWRETKLERQVKMLNDQPDLSACHAQFDVIDEEGNWIEPGYGSALSWPALLEGYGNCGASSLLVRRNAIETAGKFRCRFEPAEDYDFLLRLSRVGPIGFVPTVELSYRKHLSNQSLQYGRMYKTIKAILREHSCDKTTTLNAKLGKSAFRRALVAQALDQGRQSLHRGQLSAASKHLWWMTTHDPTSPLRALFQSIRSRLGTRWRAPEDV